MKNRAGFARRQHGGGLFVGDGDFPHVNKFARVPLDVFHRVGDNRQRPKPQKVHFQKPQFLHKILVELGHQHSVHKLHRDILRYRPWRDNHPRRMNRSMAGHSLYFSRRVNKVAHVCPFFVKPPQFFYFLQRLVNGHFKFVRHKFGDGGGFGIAHVKGAPHVANCPLGRHCAEGYYLRHTVVAIAAFHILNDFLAAYVAKINVNIRHCHPFGV